MLKLMPILEHMGACEESRWWVQKNKFATFSEAWAACPHFGWMDWVVAKLVDGEGDALRLWHMCDRASYEAAVGDVERWLVKYAHKHGCAVEVTP